MSQRVPRRQVLLTLVSLLALAAGLPVQAGDLGQRLRETVAAQARGSGFSGAVLVVHEGEVLLREGFGLADAEAGLANTPDTRFRIGSVSKQFTAAAVLLLAERGQLALDDLAGEFWIDCPPAWSEVTLRHLLHHTSGIHNVTDLPDFDAIMHLRARPADLLQRVRDLPLDFEPGSSWRYSNSGYLYLALAVEEVSGRRFEAFLADEVLAPLGLADTGSECAFESVPGLARGYALEGERRVPARPIDMNVPAGGGGLFSTVDDLARWSRALQARELLAPASWEALLTPSPGTKYGLGVRVDELEGGPRVSHSGGINGFTSWLAAYPESASTVVVLANLETYPSGELGEALQAVLLAQQPAAAGK